MPDRRRAPALDRGTVLRFWVVVLAALCVVVASQAGPWRPEQRVAAPVQPPGLVEPSAPPDQTEPDPVVEPSEVVEPGRDLGWIRRTVTIAVVAALLFLLVRWALRLRLPGRAPPPAAGGLSPPLPAPKTEPEPDLATLRRGARAAQEHLRTDVAPSDAVIAAWVALEHAAARSGVVREQSATATEFTLQVLDRTRADPSAARTLLGLYLRARFDDQPLSPHDVAAAAAAARALVETVDDPVGGRPPGREPVGSRWPGGGREPHGATEPTGATDAAEATP